MAGCRSRPRDFNVKIAYQYGIADTYRLDRRTGGLVGSGRRVGGTVADFDIEDTWNNSRLWRFRTLGRRLGLLRSDYLRNLRPDGFKVAQGGLKHSGRSPGPAEDFMDESLDRD